MTRFTAVDLARLPPLPKGAQSFEYYRASYMADLVARLASKNITYDVQSIEADTYAKTGEAFAGRSLLVATAIDDAISAVLLPYSWGPFLDALGAGQTPPVGRKPLVADPRPYVYRTAAADDWEDDDTFRARIQLAPEGLSVAGPEGAYLSFALGVIGVRGAAVYGPMSFGGTMGNPFAALGEVHIPILCTDGDGTAGSALVAAVQAAVSPKKLRPIADFVTVSPAAVQPYGIDALLRIGPGADRLIVLNAAYGRLRALADFCHRPGGVVRDQDLYVAAKVPDPKGVGNVPLAALNGWTDVNATPVTPATPEAAYVAPYCAPPEGEPIISTEDDLTVLTAGGITVRVEVVDE